MANDNETIADIVAEMRGVADTAPCGIIAIQGRVIADRIEAAAKREMSKIASKNGADFGQFGNAAKLQEVRLLVSRIAVEMTRGTITKEAPTRKEVDNWAMRLCDIIDDALAKPPRNCDVGTETDQRRRFAKMCQYNCDRCELQYSRSLKGGCELAWAQMPYKEGGAK